MLRTFFILFILVLLSSCSQKPEEERAQAIDIALSYLGRGDCDEAIEVLEEVSGDNDPIYIQVLASAHACRAGFNKIEFIDQDLTSINTTTSASILKSVSIMQLSSETEADSSDYVSIRTAIGIALNAKTQSERTSVYGTRKAGDMGVQALILNLVNLGKFLNYYGNVNALGVKGAGSGGSSCFLNYNDPRAQLLTGVSTGACAVDNDGHPDLDQSTDIGKRRLCEGLMLFTNTLDILETIDLSRSSSLSKLEEVSSKVSDFKTLAVTAGLGTLVNMTSQSDCESHLETPSQLLDMEYLYSLIFETGLQ